MEEKLTMGKQVLIFGSISGIGGIVMYLNQVRKKKVIFKRGMFLLNAFLAGWLGVIAGWAIPATIGDVKYALIGIIGFLTAPILDYIERDGLNILKEKLWILKK